jgi:germination protein M
VIRTIRSSLVQVVVVALGTVLVAGACTPTAGPLGTPSTPAPSADASVEIPSNDATPGTPAPSGTPLATVTPSGSASAAPATAAPVATPTTAPSATGTTIVRAYFFLGSFTGSGGLAPVLREIPATQAVATAAVRALLAGPNEKELGASPAMYTTVPDGTTLLGLSIAKGVATVDLSSEFGSGGGSASVVGRLAQLVYTLTQFSTVTGVRLELDGAPVTTFSGEGIVLDHPLGRADFRGQLPNIFVDRPAWGAAAGNPATVSGLANVFEATFRVQVRDAAGGLLADQQVMASCGTGCWGSFSATIRYGVQKAQWGTLKVYDLSAKDGSPQDVTEYPVWLVPAG